MNWNLFFTELLAGVTHGCVYALIALGYSMVYGILKLLNFAHGDIFMVGAFIGYGVLTVFGGATALSIPIALLLTLMFIAAMLGGGLLGVLIEGLTAIRLDTPVFVPGNDHYGTYASPCLETVYATDEALRSLRAGKPPAAP